DYVDEAKRYFEKTLERNPRHADAYYNLGVIYAYKDDLAAARDLFAAALDANPDHVLAGYGKKLMEKRLAP
ncbi:tetratricopeptide repeat protein, partial [Geobacillus thermodenitrificans]